MQHGPLRGSMKAWMLAAAMLCAAGSLAAWWLFFTLYWPVRGLFNEQGRYFDENTFVVYHEQSGTLVIPALTLALLAALLGLNWRAGRHT